MSEPKPIPLPEVLEPDCLRGQPEARSEAEVRDRLSQVEQALVNACDYGRTLWQDVDSLRGYLLRSLPPDPRSPRPKRIGAAPTGPDDEDGWQDWMAAYAEAHAVLAGPRGDSGFGVEEAQREAQVRRSAPVIRLLASHPDQASADRTAVVHRHRRVRLSGALGMAVATLVIREVLGRRVRR
jgi:hypothetical protein